jgi:electron transfer flavoprotein alpha subunit
MGSARVIVAINKDPNCPMCEKADYTIVGDLYEVAPALAEEIRRIRVEG